MLQAGRSRKGEDFLCPLNIIAVAGLYTLLDIEAERPLVWDTSAADVTASTL